MTIETVPFIPDHLDDAAHMFSAEYMKLMADVPVLSPAMAQPEAARNHLRRLLAHSAGIVAIEKGRLIGYLSWFIVNQFRGANRRAAYVPEWGHAVHSDSGQRVYQGMYRVASTQWAQHGCDAHAITLLAHDRVAEHAWYWNGFGLAVVDAIRAVEPLAQPVHTLLTIRKATVSDADMLEVLDCEHCAHYTQPPVFMTPRVVTTTDAWRVFIGRERNAVWLAEDGDTPAGFIRFDGYDCDGVGILEDEDSVFISGAYMREAYRGQRAAPALLDAALRDYQRRSFTRCTVNFESFNPEAATFWMRYFTPVAWSLVRVPEGRFEIGDWRLVRL